MVVPWRKQAYLRELEVSRKWKGRLAGSFPPGYGKEKFSRTPGLVTEDGAFPRHIYWRRWMRRQRASRTTMVTA